MKKLLLNLVLCWVLLGGVSVQAGQLLFVPMDNRPVCNDYAVDTLRKAGVDVAVPPEKFLANAEQNADVQGLSNWLKEQAPKGGAVVLSTDAIIYGGLVGSRTHELTVKDLQQMLENLFKLIEENKLKVYAYSTIMRTPRASSGRVEPPYYAQWGSKIFRHSQLMDKEEINGLTQKERKEYQALTREIPREFLQDWQVRREKNLWVNSQLINAAIDGKFEYFILGKDDTAAYSASHRDARLLAPVAEKLNRGRYQNFVGADQLGLLLALRAVNDFNGKFPVVYAQYNQGVGGETIPTYEDTQLKNTVEGHIWALGGYPAKNEANGEFFLMLNTPIKGKTLEAGDVANRQDNEQNGAKTFVNQIVQRLHKGQEVAVADIAYGNGADNALVRELFAKDIAYDLAAYSGWNTASNSVGYALAQGMLSRQMKSQARKDLLAVRYTDDWAYQANVRMEVYKQLIWPKQLNGSNMGENTKQVQEFVEKKLREFMQPYLQSRKDLRITIPWRRMFEVGVTVAAKS